MTERAQQVRTSPPSLLASPWFFFALVFCWTWSFWIAAPVLRISIQTTPGLMLLTLGLLGPMFGGIVCTSLTQNQDGRREYWLRVVDLRRIPARWYPAVILFVPALMGIAVLIDVASGETATLAQIENRVRPFLAAPGLVVPFLLRVFLRGPLPEELGWRGYVLDRLQARWNALTASLILGTVWALWHLPLFFFKDMLHAVHGAGSLWFWQFMAGVVAMAVILTWIFNNTRRSTLAAILFHFMANITAEMTNVSAGTNLYFTLLSIVAAVAVVAFWGAGTLTRRAAPPVPAA